MTTLASARRSACLLVVPLLIAAGISGCSAAESKATCARVETEIASITSRAVTNVRDSTALQKVYTDGAARLRSLAKDSGIADETEKVAAAMEKLARQIAVFASALGTTMPKLDTSALTAAGNDLRNACS